jgi:hypothetical protein
MCVGTVVGRIIGEGCRLGNPRCGKLLLGFGINQPLQGAEKVEKTTGVIHSLSYHKTNMTKWS